MKQPQIITQKQCNRCKYKWYPINPTEPTRCANCNSPYWNKERTRKCYNKAKIITKSTNKKRTLN